MGIRICNPNYGLEHARSARVLGVNNPLTGKEFLMAKDLSFEEYVAKMENDRKATLARLEAAHDGVPGLLEVGLGVPALR